MLLFELPIISGFQFLMVLLGAIMLIGGAIITLMATRSGTVSGIQVKRAEASEALVRTRDAELADAKAKEEKAKEELEDVTAELRGQMAINVDELMRYWETRDAEIAEMANLRREVRILKIRLGDIKE